MEAITAELIMGENKRDERGHRLYDDERRRRILENYDKSGLTQKAYAKKEGVKYCTLISWLQGRRRSGLIAKPKMRFEELRMPAGSLVRGLEVVLPDGTVVRGASAGDIAELVRLLRV